MTNSNSYPFRSKRSILTQLATDDTFVVECLGILYHRQTTDEQTSRTTKYDNARGFMSSHAVNASRLVEKGVEWDSTEWALARSIVSRYGKQLASHFRSEEIAKEPKLAWQAASFFTGTAA